MGNWRFAEQLSEPVSALGFSEDGASLASGSGPWIRIFGTSTWEITSTLRPRQEHVWDVAFSPDGRWTALSYGYEGVDLYDRRDGAWTRLSGFTSDSVYDLRFSADGSLLTAADGEGVRIWEIGSGAPERFDPVATTQTVVPFDGGRRLAVGAGTDDSGVHLVDRSGAKEPILVPGLRWAGMQITRDSATLVAMQGEGGIAVVETATGAISRRIGVAERASGALALSSDDRLVAAGSADFGVRVWELETGRMVHHFEGHAAEVYALAFSPDGRLLASGGRDTTVLVWSLE